MSIEIPKFEQTSDWGSLELSNAQLEYAATDVLHLHKLKKILDGILIREGRDKLAKDMFDFLPKVIFSRFRRLGYKQFAIPLVSILSFNHKKTK